MSDIKETTKEDDALLEAFSPLVNRLIDRNYESSKDKIALQMAPLVGSAIREQIKSHKDDVIDALYPVLGSMISRYVSKTLEETLNAINQQIQRGLSFEALSRKIRAKIKGVSETELLLNESATSSIRTLLLIHKETGIILCEANDPDSALQEPEMVASMMSAIRSFVNDWIDKNDSHKEIGEIEFSGNKIILENSGYCYLAVIVNGAVYNRTYQEIQKVLETIILKHSKEIREFDGDLSIFHNSSMCTQLSSLLSIKSQEEEKRKRLHPLIYFIPLLLVAFISTHFYKDYLDNTISTQVKEKILKNPQISLYKIDVSTQDSKLTLNGEVPFEYHKNLIQNIVSQIEEIKEIENKIKIVSTLKDPMQTSANISYLLKGLNTNSGINITYKYDYPNLIIKGQTWDKTRKELVQKEIKKIENIKNIEFKIEVLPPALKISIYFKKNSSELEEENLQKLMQVSKKLALLDDGFKVVLNGYSDETGSKSANKYIINERLQSVYSILSHRAKISQKIEIYNNQETPISSTPKYARCVIISLEK